MREPEIRAGLVLESEYRLTPRDGATVVDGLLIGDGYHWQQTLSGLFEGRIEPLEPSQGNIRLVNTLSVERYLASVVSSEMNPSAHTEFKKAHAVISRSWALRKVYGCDTPSAGRTDSTGHLTGWDEADSHVGFHVCSDDHCQRYQGLPSALHPGQTPDWLAATRGEVLVDPTTGQIADTRFSKCCGGHTARFSSAWADSDYIYLPEQVDPWCDLSEMDEKARREFLSTILKDYDRTTHDFYRWQETVGKQTIADRLRSRFGRDTGTVTAVSVSRCDSFGRATELCVEGTGGTLRLGKELWIRRLLGEKHLKSSVIRISDLGDRVRIDGRGWGHGVGLCQIGAARMAAAGHDYRSILSFYFPTTQISKLYD